MADGVIENIFLVNAPAGSGKTTWIREKVESHLSQNPIDNVLCITFTNRAAEELGKDLDNNRVYFGTIHSFINKFICTFFSHRSIINLYWEVYQDQILKHIENIDQKSNWAETNEKYKEKYGCLDLETIRSNIKAISYNETPFCSLYKGALGHDDLVSFTKIAADRFPVIKKKISEKYSLIFIDEYQDTASDVLDIFYTSVLGKKNKLFLLGDKMQQIYKNYNGEFEEKFKLLNKSINLPINYRSTPKIVDILNKIYNDDYLKQYPYEKNSNNYMAFPPKVQIVKDIKKSVSDFRKTYKDALILYLSNKSRFYEIGIDRLYDAYSKMKKYSFGKKYNAVDVLTKKEIRDNDALLSFLFLANQIVRNYTLGRFGEVFMAIHNNHACCDYERYTVKKHIDKHIIKELLEAIANSYNETSMTVDRFLNICLGKQLIKKEFFLNIVEDSDYLLVKDVLVHEVKVLADYLSNPTISTQHGVKGESHDTVVFVADNSNNPIVNTSKFFEIWSNMNITLSDFDEFYYCYSKMIQDIEIKIKMKCSDLKKETYNSLKNTIDNILQTFISNNESNPYYIYLLKDKMDKYNSQNNLNNVKDCLKERSVLGPLCAYRLFYVGCSRARKNLIIMINEKDVVGFKDKLQRKLISCGFEVEINKDTSI